MGLAPRDIQKLGVVFPIEDPNNPLIALPLVLPMGWKNSPPVFCTATETIADLTNNSIKLQTPMPQHPLSTLASLQDEDATTAQNAHSSALSA